MMKVNFKHNQKTFRRLRTAVASFAIVFAAFFISVAAIAQEAGEKPVSEYLVPEFAFSSAFSYPRGSVDLFSEVDSPFYNLRVGFSIPNLQKGKKISELKFNPESVGFRFSPIVYSSDKKVFKPVLSFFTGKIYEGRDFKKLYTCSFSNILYNYSGVSFRSASIRNSGNFNISKKGLSPDFGIELSISNFELNFLASRSKKTNFTDYGIFFAWGSGKNGLANFQKNKSSVKHNLFISTFTGFSHSAKKILKQDKPKFNSVYGASFIYKNDFFGFETTMAGSIRENKKQGLNFSIQADGAYKWFGIKSGVSYASKYFLGFKNTFSKTNLCCFVNPQFKTEHFSLRSSYSFFILPPRRTEDYTRGMEQKVDTASGEIKLNYTYAGFSTLLKYKKYRQKKYGEFSSGLSLKILEPNVKWFDFFKTDFSFNAVNKMVNPYILSKYKFEAGIGFNISENINFRLSADFLQKNRKKSIKQGGKKIKVFSWEKYQMGAECNLDFKQSARIGKHKFSIKLRVFNMEPYYKFLLLYNLNTR
ncbi:MAG: hypothetical protein CR988_01120 [Treponema sp.]|nr:MAG: hypothetical protein CR988_01120 [Treponema sp.]